MQRGTGYAHTKTGKCIAFTGEQSRMMALCDKVRRYNKGDSGPVVVDTSDWHEPTYIHESACFAHLKSAA